jgi:hypothetical protein
LDLEEWAAFELLTVDLDSQKTIYTKWKTYFILEKSCYPLVI